MSKAVRDALLGFTAAMAEAKAETTREAQMAGIAAAKAEGGGTGVASRPTTARRSRRSWTCSCRAGRRPRWHG